MPDTTILVTGATGYMAERCLPALRGRYALRLVDIRDTDRHGQQMDGVHLADLTGEDRSVFASLFDGVDVVVHLAWRPSAANVYDVSTPQIDKFEHEFANVRMAQNVYRCAFDAGVRRVVVASSNHAADWYEHAQVHTRRRDRPVDPYELPLSDNFYGWSKATYEHLGFLYASGAFGRQLEVVQMRIGAPRDIDASTYAADEPLPPSPGPAIPTGLARYKRDLGAWLSERDGQQLLLRAIEVDQIRNADGVPWLVVYAISDNTRAFWSLASARTVLGYEPEDDSEVAYAADIRRLVTDPGAAAPGRVGA